MHTTRISANRDRLSPAVSGDREPYYERPSTIRVIPEEFFDSRIKIAAVCPESALMYAVLEDALRCFQKQFGMDRRHTQRAKQAEEWFFSDDFHWIFSFVSVCDVLGIQPQFIRMKLKHWSRCRLNTLPRKI
jgi:hypothetical protein